MTGTLSLLRRKPSRPPRNRRAAAACAAIALAAPAGGSAGSLQPDPATGPPPAQAGLQPDAFDAPTRADDGALPVRHTDALSPLAKEVVKAPLTQRPAAPAASAVQLPHVVRPVVTPAVTTPAAPKPHVVQRRAAPHAREQKTVKHAAATHAAVKRRSAPHLRLPVAVRGSVALPARARTPAAPVRTVVRHTELRPAALALLALVVTSGCFLAVAARLRRERLGS
jgi:hypothetical protein